MQSIFLGTLPLAFAALIALVLTLTRTANKTNSRIRDRVISLFLLCIALQFLHFVEEYVTRFNERFPQLLGLAAWSNEFFVSFNLIWITVWTLSAIGLRANFRPAFFAVWFLIISMVLNGVAHPVLAIAAGGYFPGLWTSPFLGVMGLMLGLDFWKFTAGY